jgi:hypothetical protein
MCVLSDIYNIFVQYFQTLQRTALTLLLEERHIALKQ